MATLPTPMGAASVATRLTRASTAASSVSGLTDPSASGARTEARTVGTYVANAARDAEFDALQLRPQMRDLMRLHPHHATTVATNSASHGGAAGVATPTAAAHLSTGRSLTPTSGRGSWHMCEHTSRRLPRHLRLLALDETARGRRLWQLPHPGFSRRLNGPETTTPCEH
jgi:hypothetical protein